MLVYLLLCVFDFNVLCQTSCLVHFIVSYSSKTAVKVAVTIYWLSISTCVCACTCVCMYVCNKTRSIIFFSDKITFKLISTVYIVNLRNNVSVYCAAGHCIFLFVMWECHDRLSVIASCHIVINVYYYVMSHYC